MRVVFHARVLAVTTESVARSEPAVALGLRDLAVAGRASPRLEEDPVADTDLWQRPEPRRVEPSPAAPGRQSRLPGAGRQLGDSHLSRGKAAASLPRPLAGVFASSFEADGAAPE